MNAAYRIVWKAKDVVKKVDEQIGRNLDKVGVFLQAKIVNSFGSPPMEPNGKGGIKQNSSKAWKRSYHSKPGEPPFVQTGTLRRSITFLREGRKLLVGSSLQPQGNEHSYAWLLEMGSPGGQLEARPYLRPAVRNNRRTIAKMVAERA